MGKMIGKVISMMANTSKKVPRIRKRTLTKIRNCQLFNSLETAKSARSFGNPYPVSQCPNPSAEKMMNTIAAVLVIDAPSKGMMSRTVQPL